MVMVRESTRLLNQVFSKIILERMQGTHILIYSEYECFCNIFVHMELHFWVKECAVSVVGFFRSVHARFREHALYGPFAFGLLTVSLLLPPFGGAATDAIKYAFLLFTAALVCFSSRKGMKGVSLPWLYKWIALFLIWLTVVTLSARDPLFAFVGAYPRYNSSWLVYSSFVGTIWLCIYMGGGLRATIERLLLGTSFCIAVFGLLQSFGIGYYAGIVSSLAATPDRVPSLMGNPNFSSWYVAAVLPFALFYLLRAGTFIRKMWWIAYIFLSMWSLAIFTSRGAIVAAVTGYCVFTFCLCFTRQWRVVATLVGFGLFSLVLFSGYYHIYRPQQTSGFLAIQDSSANDRYSAWFIAGTVWAEHKWLGIGPGNFDQYYWERLPTTRMGGDQYFDDPHNVLLAVLVDLGAPGFLLFAVLLAAAAIVVLRQLHSREWGGWAPAAAGVSAWFVSGLFNPAVIGLWLLLAILLANILSYSRNQGVTIFTHRSVSALWKILGLGLCALAASIILGEYALVYAIALESYKTNPQAAHQQLKLTEFTARFVPYNLEVRAAAIFTKTRAGESAPVLRREIRAAFNLHPYSTRAGLVAAQLTADLWYRGHQAEDLDQADTYLQTALTRSNGYPVVGSWAAVFYWRTGRFDLAKRYAQYATYKQPHYLDNWLLLAKIYREENNLEGMQAALDKAQALIPGNVDLAKMRKQLRDARDVHAVELRPGELSTITRLH